MKKFLPALLGVFGAGAAFAEDPAPTIDLSAATTQMTAMQTAVSGWISSNVGTLVALLGSVLVVTLIFVAFKWITRGTKKAG